MEDQNDTGRREQRDGEGLPDVPRIRLQSPSGLVIDHTLPLHEAIAHQWRNGELQRVNHDGEAWEGDEYDLSSAYGTDADVRQGVDGEDETVDEPGAAEGDAPELAYPDGGTRQPERPADDAPKAAWQRYAVEVGAVPEAEASKLTRQQLIDRSTPPELKPGVQP